MCKLFASLSIFLAVAFCLSSLQAQTTPKKELTAQEKFQEELSTSILQAYEGDSNAQFKVGVLYTNDQFTESDFERAVYWYKQAARQNHILAQYNLGHQYLLGRGVKKDAKKAMKWWLKAARLNHPLSQFNIGRAYYLGIGLPMNLDKSRFWFEKAAANHEPKSIAILKELQWDTLTPESIAAHKAQNKAEEANKASETDITKEEPVLASNTAIAQTASELNDNTETTQDSIQSITAKVTDSVSVEAQTIAESTKKAEPITLYTNPSISTVLISEVSDRTKLVKVDEIDQWVSVRHKDGFPLWVHQNFLSIQDSVATLTGDKVNARAVPVISKGSIVGQLKKGEKLQVLEKSQEWYRLTSPTDFTAWVKSQEFNETTQSNSEGIAIESVTPNNGGGDNAKEARMLDSNEWLFKQNASHYTLQLASFDNSQSVAKFLSDSGLKDDINLYKFTSSANNINWTYFLYGAYESKETAQQKQKSLKTQNAWARNIGRIQQNRCLAWKKRLPSPKELNIYCASSD